MRDLINLVENSNTPDPEVLRLKIEIQQINDRLQELKNQDPKYLQNQLEIKQADLQYKLIKKQVHDMWSSLFNVKKSPSSLEETSPEAISKINDLTRGH